MTKQFFKLELLIFALSETEHNFRIEKIAQMIITDHVSIDEQDQLKLKKYYDFAVQNYSLESGIAKELVHEAFLYLKLKLNRFLSKYKNL